MTGQLNAQFLVLNHCVERKEKNTERLTSLIGVNGELVFIQGRNWVFGQPWRVTTMAAQNRNLKLKKSHLFFECLFIWLNNFQFVFRRKSNFVS